MQVSSTNDVKQYNFTAGRSLPEWLDERKRRRLLQKDVELRRRVELLQDFTMPTVSDCIRLSADGDYIIATGTYKPRVRCYDVHELGLKFERCLDSEVAHLRILGDDYSKLALLRCDRYLEFHSQQGRYYQLRIPFYGRGMEYQTTTCELLFVGASSQIVRLNLEQGRFLAPMVSREATGINACALNPLHEAMLVVGTAQGMVEAWDTRAAKAKVATLDCALSAGSGNVLPQVTSLAFRDGLNLGVGTSTGHVLLYDIRSSKPLVTKDHMYGEPVKKIAFHSTLDQVVSLDNRVAKIWDRLTGKAYTSIEAPPEVRLNDIAVYPGSGLIFLANEQPKMQVHYVPSMGHAPRWCSFLDNIIEEMEESQVSNVYDDYKFVTQEELDDVGMDHLIGTTLLRAYMHGYFMDARLYEKVRAIAKPYSVDRLVKDKIKRKLEEKRTKRVQIKNQLPSVNKDLFLKLKDRDASGRKKKANANLLQDDRFSAMFTDSMFEVDKNEEAFKLINPVLTKLDDAKMKKIAKQFEEVEPAAGGDGGEDRSSGDSDIESEEESSDDDDREWTQAVRESHKQLRVEKAVAKRQERDEELAAKLSEISRKEKLKATESAAQPRFYELKEGETLGAKRNGNRERLNRAVSLSDRLQRDGGVDGGSEAVKRGSGHSMTFKTKRSRQQLKAAHEAREHRQERQTLRRSASHLKKKRLPPKFFMGKRVS